MELDEGGCSFLQIFHLKCENSSAPWLVTSRFHSWLCQIFCSMKLSDLHIFFLSLSLLVSSILYSKILPNFYLKWSSSFFFLKLGSPKAWSKAIFIWENTLFLAASSTQVFLMKLQTQCRHRPRLWILPIHCLFSHWLLK